jgi:hypothetical protein
MSLSVKPSPPARVVGAAVVVTAATVFGAVVGEAGANVSAAFFSDDPPHAATTSAAPASPAVALATRVDLRLIVMLRMWVVLGHA